jgi:FkbM family methyltransferase
MLPEPTLSALPALFDTSPSLHAGSVDSASLPITFETSARVWNYALSFKRATSGQPPSGAIVVRLTLEVLSGKVGAGVLKGDGRNYLDEVIVGTGTHVVEIVIRDCAIAGDLMVRNASLEGKSHGRILAIESFSVKVDLSPEERDPGLSFPRPTPHWNRYYGTDLPTAVEKLRAQAFETLTAPDVVRWSDGLSFRVVPNDQVSRALYVSGTYEPNTLYVLRTFLQAGAVFLDVGANAGVFSLVASRYVGASGRVYSFEPSEREYRRLLDVIQLNGLEGRMTPVQVAVGARPGHEMLRVAAPPYSGLNTLGTEFPYDGVDVSNVERVAVTTLDEYSRRQHLSRIDVIKIDIEGAESAALAGSASILQRLRPVLIIELFSRALVSNGASVSELQEHLQNADYRFFQIDDETAGLTRVEDLTTVDEQNIVAVPSERT